MIRFSGNHVRLFTEIAEKWLPKCIDGLRDVSLPAVNESRVSHLAEEITLAGLDVQAAQKTLLQTLEPLKHGWEAKRNSGHKEYEAALELSVNDESTTLTGLQQAYQHMLDAVTKIKGVEDHIMGSSKKAFSDATGPVNVDITTDSDNAKANALVEAVEDVMPKFATAAKVGMPRSDLDNAMDMMRRTMKEVAPDQVFQTTPLMKDSRYITR